MKELDKTKAYDLRDLNDEQLEKIRKECIKQGAVELFENSKDFKELKKEVGVIAFGGLFFPNEWYFSCRGFETTNALDLFLKIGDTFEYNGYICEVKKPIKKWVYDTYQEAYCKMEKINSEYQKEITNQTLIKLLEENAIH